VSYAGRRRTGSELATANYDGTVAAYRQTALTAFQEVEDNLAALRILDGDAERNALPYLTAEVAPQPPPANSNLLPKNYADQAARVVLAVDV
jgi:hypothetical protein